MYRITRGYTGGALTPAQRTSSLFQEEPVVLGKVLRRGAAPILLTQDTYRRNEVQLKRLEKAGSIKIESLAIETTVVDDLNPEEQAQMEKDFGLAPEPMKGQEEVVPTVEQAQEMVDAAADALQVALKIEAEEVKEVAPVTKKKGKKNNEA